MKTRTTDGPGAWARDVGSGLRGGGDRSKLGAVKARFAFAVGLGSVAVVTTTVRAEVEFAGYMRTPQGEARFVLADPAAQKTSEWIAVGGNFAGYRVTGFEAKSETLAVEKDGVAGQLRLKSAAVTDAAGATVDAAAAGSATPTTKAEAAASLLIWHLANATQGMTRELEVKRGPQGEVYLGLAEEQWPRAQIEEAITRVTRAIDRDTLELGLVQRTLLLQKIREHASGDSQGMKMMLAALRELNARQAKAGVVAAPPAAAK